MKLNVLVVDDDDVTRKLLKEVLEKENYSVYLAASGEEAISAVKRQVFAIVVSDIRMAGLDGMAVLRAVKRSSDKTIVILMTGFGSMEGAIDAIREGAFDYVSKPFKMNDLKNVIARAATQHRSLSETGSGKAGGLEISAANEKGLIGRSPRIVEVYKTLARAALSSSAVLVIGESGTGKELVARAVHDNSARRAKKFVPVNCSALNEALLESELFGPEGLLFEAEGGTLFFDEIGDLPPSIQVKLLRVLEEEEFRSSRVDVRLVAATHQDLESLVRAGKFREDLFYRLKAITIELPPLRERMEDLPELVSHFLARFSAKDRKPVSHVSDEAMELLKAYAWPGNIRELEHAIERAVAMTRSSVLYPEDFPQELSRGPAPATEGAGQATGVSPEASLEDLEKAHIVRVLNEVNFNKSRASEILGIDRATLYRKAQRYGIDLRGK